MVPHRVRATPQLLEIEKKIKKIQQNFAFYPWSEIWKDILCCYYNIQFCWFDILIQMRRWINKHCLVFLKYKKYIELLSLYSNCYIIMVYHGILYVNNYVLYALCFKYLLFNSLINPLFPPPSILSHINYYLKPKNHLIICPFLWWNWLTAIAHHV